jgi:hypothetical protein
MLSVREIEGGDGFQLYGVPADWSEFRAAVMFAASVVDPKAEKEGRPMLGGVRVEACGIHAGIVATDRYRLAWAHLSGHPVDQFMSATVERAATIPAREFVAGVKSAKISGPFSLVIDNAAGVWSLSVNDSTISGRTILGKFPEWRGLVPELPETSAGGFSLDPKLVATIFSSISSAFGGSKCKPVTLSQAAENKPVLLSGFAKGALALIMPVRVI